MCVCFLRRKMMPFAKNIGKKIVCKNEAPASCLAWGIPPQQEIMRLHWHHIWKIFVFNWMWNILHLHIWCSFMIWPRYWIRPNVYRSVINICLYSGLCILFAYYIDCLAYHSWYRKWFYSIPKCSVFTYNASRWNASAKTWTKLMKHRFLSLICTLITVRCCIVENSISPKIDAI